MKTSLLIATSAIVLASGGSALAQDITGNVTLASEYIFRGYTQTDNGLAIQGGFDFEIENFYAGTWASNLDFNDGTSIEVDFYAGVTSSAWGFDFDFGGIYYAYPDSPDTAGEQDFFEAYAGISRSYGAFGWDAKISYSPDFYLETGVGWYREVGVSYQIADNFGIDARFASSAFDDNSSADYDDYQIGVSTSAMGLDWGLRWHDSNATEGRFVLSAGKSF